ncbi:unnamed protein product [Diatraea saccharalis]|uniref:BED-type domain-containing protein n=1 Tax=Diatraea saccharalis TaxID=40085 RepID=A0A9N9R5F2_9NEOP|nr:unnamed protein product [Diatraea saccharalis]
MVSEVESEDEEIMTETYLEEESEQIREKHPRTSVVWKYYEPPNREERTAVCKCCQETLSYKSSISNLKKHLQRKHKMFNKHKFEEEMLTETYLEEESDEDEQKDKRKTLRSGVWEYFMVADEQQRTATCQLCSEEFSYRTTSSNLSRHLQRRHGIGTALKHSDTDNDDAEDKSIVRKPSNRTSIAWDYFTIKDDIKKIATCKVCDSDRSYLTSTSNLVKHVRRKHGMGYFVDVDNEDDDTNLKESDAVSHKRSSLWLYFKSIDKVQNIAMCLICKKRLSYLTSITNLKRHLTRKHPHLQVNGIMNTKNMLLASDGQLYEIDDSEKPEVLDDNDEDDDQNADPMEIYLDEADGEIVTKSTKKPVKNFKKVVVDESNDSSDNEITFKKRYIKKNNDSLDKFGKYLVSLLRELPQAVSNQLQADFVKQIMNYQNNETVDVNNRYVTTITECDVDEKVAVSSASNDGAFIKNDNS